MIDSNVFGRKQPASIETLPDYDWRKLRKKKNLVRVGVDPAEFSTSHLPNTSLVLYMCQNKFGF
jgi:hypothetical protein